MLAVPISSAGVSSSGPRPINLTKDTRQVLELLDLSFGRIPGSQGRRVLYDRLSLSQANSFILRLNMMTGGLIPGFVWAEGDRIIGSLTLLTSEVPGRFLIANVAVHPDHRRRGIARALMEEGLNHVASQNGQTVMLQVEHDNEPAMAFYQSLGFRVIGTMNRWQTAPSRLRTIPIQSDFEVTIRGLGRQDSRAAYKLDRASVTPDLNWPAPPRPDFYKYDLGRKVGDFLNGRKFLAWVSENRSIPDGKRRLTGLSSISSEWGRPIWLRMRVDPAWQGKVELQLMNKVLRQLKRMGNSTISMNHPFEDDLMNHLLSQANFRIQRSLTFMFLNLDSKG